MKNEITYPIWNRDRIYYDWEEDNLRIGSDDVDVTEIKGNRLFWQDLISLCDGSRNVKQIFSEINSKHHISNEQLENFLVKFNEKNFIELLSSPKQHNDFNQFFDSSMLYYSSEGLGGNDLLSQLQKMKITIFGCGGGGSHIALQLANLGVGSIHLVDSDVVELKNINRQTMFSISDIGLKKVEVTKKKINNNNKYCNITTTSKMMMTINDIEKQLQDADWVFCCMDFPPYIAQRLVNKVCFEMEVPSIYAFSQRSAGKVLIVNPKDNNSACLDCLLCKHDSEHFQILVNKFLTTNQELGTATVLSNIYLLTSWIVKKWLNQLIKSDSSNLNTLFRFDFDSFAEEKFDTFNKSELCPTCQKSLNKSKLWEVLSIE
ncbi:ThiF family adenylyltransferase [Streptococcus hongkongensis]|nr:heme biosynthesis protein HemY [Streptococcus uberis]